MAATAAAAQRRRRHPGGRLAATLLTLTAIACAHAGDGVDAGAASTEASPAPTPSETPTSATSAPTTVPPSVTTETTGPEGADVAGDVESRDLGDDPVERPTGRGRIAAAPAPGPLVDGSAGPTSPPAVVVKIDNAPQARPQLGLTEADIVFEELVEGISRFAAVFASSAPTVVGPVRSARTSDVALVSMFGRPCFGFSGGNSGVVAAVDASPLRDLSAEALSSAYWRADDREIPHNLFTSVAALRALCVGRSPTAAAPVFPYSGDPPAGDEPGAATVGGVDIEIGASRSQFVWDDDSRRWLRYVSGGADLDAAGTQVSPTDVVIVETRYAPSPADLRSPEAQTIGSGAAYVLRDGTVTAGTWRRASAAAPYSLNAADGSVLALRPGRTWVALVPPGGGFRFFDRDLAASILAG